MHTLPPINANMLSKLQNKSVQITTHVVFDSHHDPNLSWKKCRATQMSYKGVETNRGISSAINDFFCLLLMFRL